MIFYIILILFIIINIQGIYKINKILLSKIFINGEWIGYTDKTMPEYVTTP